MHKLTYLIPFSYEKQIHAMKIQLSTKLIIQHYSKTKYKMHELTQNKYDNAF